MTVAFKLRWVNTVSVSFSLHRCYCPYGTPTSPPVLSTCLLAASTITWQCRAACASGTHAWRHGQRAELRLEGCAFKKSPPVKSNGAQRTWHILLHGPAPSACTHYPSPTYHTGISSSASRPICSLSNCGSVRGSGRWAAGSNEAGVLRRSV